MGLLGLLGLGAALCILPALEAKTRVWSRLPHPPLPASVAPSLLLQSVLHRHVHLPSVSVSSVCLLKGHLSADLRPIRITQECLIFRSCTALCMQRPFFQINKITATGSKRVALQPAGEGGWSRLWAGCQAGGPAGRGGAGKPSPSPGRIPARPYRQENGNGGCIPHSWEAEAVETGCSEQSLPAY